AALGGDQLPPVLRGPETDYAAWCASSRLTGRRPPASPRPRRRWRGPWGGGGGGGSALRGLGMGRWGGPPSTPSGRGGGGGGARAARGRDTGAGGERGGGGGQTPDEATLRRESQALAARDAADASRAVAPLRPAADAVLLDTTHLSFEDQVARIVALARER